KQDLLDARDHISGMIHHTPVMTSATFDKRIDGSVFFKCENFQRMGAYKMRGASHALAMLTTEQQKNGVLTHSSGNFAQALALSAKIKQIHATIVMPDNAPAVKVDAVRGYGAEIVSSGTKPVDRENKVNDILTNSKMTFIHPSNDLQVILGNSTCTQELLEEVSGLDIIIAPVGGGGLLAGTALAAHYFSPSTVVWAAEPENVDDAFRSLQSGQIEINETAITVADGLRTNLGDINFPIIQHLVERVLLVSEDEIIDAMRWIWERMKIVIEPSSAVAVAAVIRYADDFAGKRTGVILTGGNVDLNEILRLFGGRSK
nr:pyridoxal-phosphate dependent enzyme [Bacteroidota bacterium]